MTISTPTMPTLSANKAGEHATEYAVVGGGIVGLSVAYGLASAGKQVVVYDEGDLALRASRGNFGLVWVQSKGLNQPAYARWTRRSASLWPAFADELQENTGMQLSLEQRGGFSYHLTEAALYERADQLTQLKQALGGDYPFEVLGHNALKKEEPNIGPQVAGAILHHEDGHLNSLQLLQALAIAVRKKGVTVRVQCPVAAVRPDAQGFELHSNSGVMGRSEHIVLCAGLGSLALGASLGFSTPIRPQRGQVLITEKIPRLMHRPSDVIRQVNEGGVQIGASAEEAGFDPAETTAITASLANDAVSLFPQLQSVNLVRSWGALRIMSPDGLPVYQRSETHPRASFVTCHSGITLAAAHARCLPEWLQQTPDAPDLGVFSEIVLMFKKLVEDRREQVAFRFEGQNLMADEGSTVAAALLRAGETHLRTTSSGVSRGPYCMMGACYECLVTVDGVNRQACQIVVKQGMDITRVQTLVGGAAVASAHE